MCVWYGECEKKDSLVLNCPYNGTAKPLTDPDALKVLQTWCPDFVQDYSEGKSIVIINCITYFQFYIEIDNIILCIEYRCINKHTYTVHRFYTLIKKLSEINYFLLVF